MAVAEEERVVGGVVIGRTGGRPRVQLGERMEEGSEPRVEGATGTKCQAGEAVAREETLCIASNSTWVPWLSPPRRLTLTDKDTELLR